MKWLLQIYRFVKESGVRPETTAEEWLDIITYMYDKDWLYCEYEENKLVTVVGAYRIKEYKEELSSKLPTCEEGTILYIPFSCSVSKDKLMQRKMLKKYLKKHEISELIFKEHKNNERLRRIKIGERYGRIT